MSYADDLTLIIPRDKTTIHTILDSLKAFKDISGLEVNITKTVCINIGKNREPITFNPSIPLAFETNFKLLGINFTCNASDTDQNFDTIGKLIEESMKFWSRRIFTPLGRTMALKTFILSKYTHKALVLPSPPKKWVDNLQLKINHFIFKRKSYPISRAQMSLPITLGGFNIPDIEEFWNSLKIKLLLKTNYSTDPYATLFNKSLSDLNQPNINELTTKGPETIRQTAEKLNNPYWTPALIAWSKCVAGYAISSDKALLNTAILGNPIFGKPWHKNLNQPKTMVFGIPKASINQADFSIDLRQVKFKHILNHEFYVNRETLTEILGQKVNELEYNKILPIMKNAHHILQTTHKTNHETDIISWSCTKKGTKHLKTLTTYEKLTINQLTSTKYWKKIPALAEVPCDLFTKSFKTINSIPISSKDKSDLLKIRHNIVGTPHTRSKYTDTVDDCAFCAAENREPHTSCKKSALPEILLTCKTTQSFTQTIALIPSLSKINFKTDPVSRLIHQEDKINSTVLNYAHAMVNLYLRKTAYYKKIPTIPEFFNFLQPRIITASRNNDQRISNTFLDELQSDAELFLPPPPMPPPQPPHTQ